MMSQMETNTDKTDWMNLVSMRSHSFAPAPGPAPETSLANLGLNLL